VLLERSRADQQLAGDLGDGWRAAVRDYLSEPGGPRHGAQRYLALGVAVDHRQHVPVGPGDRPRERLALHDELVAPAAERDVAEHRDVCRDVIGPGPAKPHCAPRAGQLAEQPR
jgi:hypothetical protein